MFKILNMKKKIIALLLALVFVGCTPEREVILLTNNRGISITDGRGVILPIVSFEVVDKDELLGAPYQELDGLAFLEVKELIQNSNAPVHEFSLNNTYLMIHQNYELPVIVQVAIGVPDNVRIWDYVWEEGFPLLFNISRPFGYGDPNEPIGVLISILQLDANDIVIGYERYFFMIRNLK